jgi:hypothetical protein
LRNEEVSLSGYLTPEAKPNEQSYGQISLPNISFNQSSNQPKNGGGLASEYQGEIASKLVSPLSSNEQVQGCAG